MLTYSDSPLRYPLALAIMLPMAFASSTYDCLLMTPTIVIGLTLLWYVPNRVVIIAPEHLDEALEEMEPVLEKVELIVYHKTGKKYEALLNDDD